MATSFRVKWTDLDNIYVIRRLRLQGLPFGGFVNIAPHLGVQRPQKRQLGSATARPCGDQ